MARLPAVSILYIKTAVNVASHFRERRHDSAQDLIGPINGLCHASLNADQPTRSSRMCWSHDVHMQLRADIAIRSCGLRLAPETGYGRNDSVDTAVGPQVLSLVFV